MKLDLVPRMSLFCVPAAMLVCLIYVALSWAPRPQEPRPKSGRPLPKAHRAEQETPVHDELPSLPDLNSPFFEPILRGNAEILGPLCDFYNDEYEAHRFAVDYYVEEVETQTGLEVPRGDVIDLQIDSMAGALQSIEARPWGAHTNDVHLAVRQLRQHLAAAHRANNAAVWVRMAAAESARSRANSNDGETLERRDVPNRQDDTATVRAAFAPPWPWPETAPPGWPDHELVYFSLTMYDKLAADARSDIYRMHLAEQRTLQGSLRIASRQLGRFTAGASTLDRTGALEKVRATKISLGAELVATTRMTANLRSYCVWRLCNQGGPN
jgi:hypothetical protein